MRFKTVFLGILLTVFFAFPQQASAAIVTVFDSLEAASHGTRSDLYVTSTRVRAQAFTTSSQSGTVQTLTLQDAYINPFTTGYNVSIYSDNNGTIGSQLVIFGSSPTHTGSGFLNFTPSSSYTLQTNTTYWIYVTMTSNTFYWKYTNAAVTTGTIPSTGYRAYSSNSGSTFSYDTNVSSSAYGTGSWRHDFKLTIDSTPDTTPPTITSVSSDKANGTYTTGEVIDIDVAFSEAVTSTGNVTVTLETGDTDRTCTFTASSSTTGTCNYTVQAGDTSSDLTISSISGTIADGASNAMSNFGPTTNLAANKAIVIDTTSPTTSSVSVTPSSTGATVSWATSESASSIIDYGLTSSLGSSTTEADTSPRVTSHSSSISDLIVCTTYYYRVRSRDAATNSGNSSTSTFTTTGCTGSASVVYESSSSQIATGAGGAASLTGGSNTVDLTIPAGYNGSAAYFQIKQLDKTSVINTTSSPSNYSAAGNLVYELKALTEVNTQVTSFSQPITVKMTYTDADISGLNESSLLIYRWDGSSWQALSSCSVDSSADTVTCTTSNFSTFALFGQASSSSSSSSSSTATSSTPGPPSCKDPKPVGIPDLFQVDTTITQATLYFTPVRGISGYYISYSTNSSAEEHGAEASLSSEGVQSYTINSLSPNAIYYFKVRGQNGCMPGDWSNIKSRITNESTSFASEISEKVEEALKNTAQKAVEIPIIEKAVDKKLEVTKTELKSKPSIISYIVKAGDSLWSIAREVLGAGTEYTKIVKQNVREYPELISKKLAIGTQLNIQKEVPPVETNSKENSPKKLYDIDVKILASTGKPMQGVKVTLHSTPKESITNNDGVANFKGVEEGQHRVYLAYNGYDGGGQAINITGDNKNIELVMQVDLKASFSHPVIIAVIGGLGAIILILLFVLFKKRLIFAKAK